MTHKTLLLAQAGGKGPKLSFHISGLCQWNYGNSWNLNFTSWNFWNAWRDKQFLCFSRAWSRRQTLYFHILPIVHKIRGNCITEADEQTYNFILLSQTSFSVVSWPALYLCITPPRILSIVDLLEIQQHWSFSFTISEFTAIFEFYNWFHKFIS